MSNEPGILYVVATPIGNLGDFTPRAQEILAKADVIAAEDTRHSGRLLQHFAIKTPMVSMHEHNEAARCDGLISRILAGETVAVISDAGTPLISDPGFVLIKAAMAAGIKVSPVPGACALIAALSAAGLPSDRFCFEGFLPHKTNTKIKVFEALLNETRTLIFYESPHRIVDTLESMAAVFGQARVAVVAREITKTFETIVQDSLGGLVQWINNDLQQQRGEFVVLVAGAVPVLEETESFNIDKRELLTHLLAELSLKQAVKIAMSLTGLKKNALYDLALEIQNASK